MCRASQQRSRAQTGEDRRHDLTIAFKDAVFGCSVDIDVDKMEGWVQAPSDLSNNINLTHGCSELPPREQPC